MKRIYTSHISLLATEPLSIEAHANKNSVPPIHHKQHATNKTQKPNPVAGDYSNLRAALNVILLRNTLYHEKQMAMANNESIQRNDTSFSACKPFKTASSKVGSKF